MTECDEVARAMLPAFLQWLRAEPALANRCRTLENARAFVALDPFLGDESAQRRDNVARSLYRESGRANHEQ